MLTRATASSALQGLLPGLIKPASSTKTTKPAQITPALLPEVLRTAKARLDRLVACKYDRHGAQAMRSDWLAKVRRVVSVMLGHACLQLDGIMIVLDRTDTARPITGAQIASEAGVEIWDWDRVTRDLKSMGLMVADRQIKVFARGILVGVQTVKRAFTEKFWRVLGLWDTFCKAVKWAKSDQKPISFCHKLYQPGGTKKAKTKTKTIEADKYRDKSLNCLFLKGKACLPGSCTCSTGQMDYCNRLKDLGFGNPQSEEAMRALIPPHLLLE